MARINQTRRITTEDYPKENRTLVEKLAFTLNPFLNSIVDAFNKNLTFVDNFAMQELDLEFTAPVSANKVSLRPSLKSTCRYIITARAVNTSNPGAVLTQAPFVEYTLLEDGQLQITNITGLVSGNKYNIKLLLFA